ncbi:MAG TPA: hypothetical protein VIT65_15150 [Microlunatus sp.]
MSQHEEARQISPERVPDQDDAIGADVVEQQVEVADVAGDAVLPVPAGATDTPVGRSGARGRGP